MSIYVQHGHGKSDKIQTAISQASIDGVVFSPRNEKPDNLIDFVAGVRHHPKLERIVDPQFYLSTFTPAKLRYLDQYSYFNTLLSPAEFSLKRIRSITTESLKFQCSVDATRLVSPTVLQHTFDDRWCQIAINFAEATMEAYEHLECKKPLLASLVIHESAFSSNIAMQQFLDTLTSEDWNVSGFYLIVARESEGYTPNFNPERMANLLYFVYVLGGINKFDITLGYSDFPGLPMRAAGASAIATGWTHGQRRFHQKNFIDKGNGGQPPRKRYSSGPLLNSILFDELIQIQSTTGLLEDVLSGVDLDAEILFAPSVELAEWSTSTSQLHHWQVLKQLDSSFLGKPKSDIPSMLKKISLANDLYEKLESKGVIFERSTGKSHLADWRSAITEFAQLAGIPTT